MKLLVVMFLLLYSCGKSSSYVYENKLHEGQDNLKLCFVGDLGKDTPVQFRVADAMFEEQCDEFYFLGDLVYPSGIKNIEDDQLQTKFFDYYDPLFNTSSNVRVNIALGNHDYSGNPDAWFDVVKKYPGYYFPNHYYMVDYGGLCVVVLDTNFFDEISSAGKVITQMNWLTLLQLKLKDCKVKIAVTHHPFKGANLPGAKGKWSGPTGPMKVFLDTYIVGKMDLHIAGHVHALEDIGEEDGTRMLISGAGGETRNNASTPGYVVLEWKKSNPKKISYRLRRLEPEIYTEEELQKMEAEEP